MPSSRSRRRWERIIAALLATQLSAAVTAATLLPTRPVRATQAASTVPIADRTDRDARTAAVRRLLGMRADAVLRKDRRAFLATVDPEETGFRARQAGYIAALQTVPLTIWQYELEPRREQKGTAALDARRGDWWAPQVTLRYAFTDFDRTPTRQRQGLTFVQRDGRWYIAADDDFAVTGHSTSRELWDGGPVLVARSEACLVLGHAAQAALVRALLSECDTAVPQVTAVWGRAWARQVVVLVPDTSAELSRLVPEAGDLSQIAAVATAELVAGDHPVGDRVLVNPATYLRLGATGRRVVMAHEVTHVATREGTGPHVPTWLVEGLADYIGYTAADVPVHVAAQELRAEVRAGRLPAALPHDRDFGAARPDLAQIYEQSWLAVALLAKVYGEKGLLRFYRTVGADPSAGAIDRAMEQVLGTTVEAFTATWRADLVRGLS